MRIYCESSEQVAEIYNEAKMPLIEGLKDSLVEVERELVGRGLPTSFVIIHCLCRICSHVEVAIVPACANIDNLECANCGNMSMQEKEYESEEY